MTGTNVGSPKGREPYGDTGVVVVVRVTPHQGGREGRPQGEGHQVAGYPDTERVCEMQSAETVLGVLRERGMRGLPLNELYRQLFNPELYFLAYGNIYSNKGAMTGRRGNPAPAGGVLRAAVLRPLTRFPSRPRLSLRAERGVRNVDRDSLVYRE